MTTFSELGLSDSIVSSLTELGFEEPTPIQNEAIPALLTGADVLGRAATGTGKTAAFSLPLLERHVLGQEADAPLVLVLTPTRELCLQVSEAFHNYGRKAGVLVTPIYGGQDYSRQIRALRRGTHVVVATPGRALDHIGRGTLDLTNIKAVVLDEADEMLDLGFADELDAIFDALPGHVQTALFSATLPPKIARIAEARLVDPVRITIAKEKTAEGETPRVPQIAYVVGHNYRTTALGRILDLEAPELAIIFTRTRMEVDDLTESLRARGFSVEALHGGLDQPTRDRVMKPAPARSTPSWRPTSPPAASTLKTLRTSSTSAFPPPTRRTCTASAARAAPAAPAPPSPFSSRANIVTCAPSRASRRPASKCAPCRPPRTCAPAVSK